MSDEALAVVWGTVSDIRPYETYSGLSVDIERKTGAASVISTGPIAICTVEHGAQYQPQLEDKVRITVPRDGRIRVELVMDVLTGDDD